MVTNSYMARIYIAQARAAKHQTWRNTLLHWAARRRLAALNEIRISRKNEQLDLFTEPLVQRRQYGLDTCAVFDASAL